MPLSLVAVGGFGIVSLYCVLVLGFVGLVLLRGGEVVVVKICCRLKDAWCRR